MTIPAKLGIQTSSRDQMDSRFRGNEEQNTFTVDALLEACSQPLELFLTVSQNPLAVHRRQLLILH
jgi:hypothetical protein